MVKPHIPLASAASPDDDPTGVRALLAALPEPDPMPEHLVARINASLAAEQSQRAAQTSSEGVTPLLATGRRRSGRLLFAMAGAAAAAVVLVGVVASNLFLGGQPVTTTSSAARDSAASAREASPAAPLSAQDKADKADKAAAGRAPNLSLVQIRYSDTRYTQAGFVAQARSLQGATLDPNQPGAVQSSSLGPAGTAPGLIECLSAIGAGGAQVVRADVAFYEEGPAVIIVATTDGVPVAYAVGRQCSPADGALMHSGTPLR